MRPPSDAPFTQSRCYTTCQYMSHMFHHNRLCVLGPMYLLPTPGSASHSLNRVNRLNTAMAVPFSGGRKPTPRSVRIVSMHSPCKSNAIYTATGAGGGGARRRELTRVRSNAHTVLSLNIWKTRCLLLYKKAHRLDARVV